MPRTPSPEGPTPKRNVRIPDRIWDPALDRVDQENQNLPEGAKKQTLTTVMQERMAIYGLPLPEDAPVVDPWTVIETLLADRAQTAFRDTTRTDLAITAAADLLRTLGIRTSPGVNADRAILPSRLRRALTTRLSAGGDAPEEAGMGLVTLGRDLIPYLEGLADAGVAGAADLAQQIDTHDEVVAELYP